MPLSRAVVPAEQALASPHLLEPGVVPSGPQTLLEHASLARLVGLVRQLADLAE